jgi:hypothetical protein
MYLMKVYSSNIPDEGLFQKRAVRTDFDIYVFIT